MQNLEGLPHNGPHLDEESLWMWADLRAAQLVHANKLGMSSLDIVDLSLLNREYVLGHKQQRAEPESGQKQIAWGKVGEAVLVAAGKAFEHFSPSTIVANYFRKRR